MTTLAERQSTRLPRREPDRDYLRAKVTIGDNGRIVIPAEIREAFDLKPGVTLVVHASETGITMKTRRMALTSLQRAVAKHVKPGVSVADELIADRRAEVAREEREDAERRRLLEGRRKRE